MLIYCNGDSYAAGAELADHLFFKDHPGYTETDSNHVTRQWQQLNFNKMSVIDRPRYISEGKMRAWPAKLGVITNSTVVNSATNGASMEAIATTTINDLIKLKKTEKTITAIIQITWCSRIYIADKGVFRSVLLQNVDFIPEEIVAAQAKLRLLSETDETLYTSWLYQLIRIRDFCTSNNIKLLFVDSASHVVSQFANKYSELALLENYLNIDNLIIDSMGRYQRQGYINLCPAGHYVERIHDEFAQNLSTLL